VGTRPQRKYCLHARTPGTNMSTNITALQSGERNIEGYIYTYECPKGLLEPIQKQAPRWSAPAYIPGIQDMVDHQLTVR